MYVDKNAYNLYKVFDMHEKCSHCSLKYKIEPSFFFGAMYVSYGVGIAFGVAAFIISYFFFGSSLMTSFISIIVALVIFMPYIMRVSRNIWINMFISYDKNADRKANPN